MEDILFLQSDVADPYPLYARMLAERPVHYDARHQMWAVYSHRACSMVLADGNAHIPPLPSAAKAGGAAAVLLRNLVRLNNPPAHAGLRETAMRLFDALRPADTGLLVRQLVDTQEREFDWIGAVCKKLPAMALLHGLGMDATDIDFLLPRLAPLAKLMLPQKTGAQLAETGAVAAQAWPVLDAHARKLHGKESDERHTANLAGLLIQAYDAGRGLLANTLLQMLRQGIAPDRREQWQSLVRETLRYDPPIQNTRRVLTRDLHIGPHVLRQGDTVLAVLAAANRDPAVFAQPERFDANRGQQDAQLSFGHGAHACISRHFMTALTADALAELSRHGVRLLPQEIHYEALSNARLVRELRIRVG